jgi:hypothetical protein
MTRARGRRFVHGGIPIKRAAQGEVPVGWTTQARGRAGAVASVAHTQAVPLGTPAHPARQATAGPMRRGVMAPPMGLIPVWVARSSDHHRERPRPHRPWPRDPHRHDAPRMSQRYAAARWGERPPSRWRPVPQPWRPGRAASGSSPARSPGPGGTPGSRTHARTRRASRQAEQRRCETTRGEEAIDPLASGRTVPTLWVMGRRPVVISAPALRTRQRCDVGVANVGGHVFPTGTARSGTLLP